MCQEGIDASSSPDPQLPQLRVLLLISSSPDKAKEHPFVLLPQELKSRTPCCKFLHKTLKDHLSKSPPLVVLQMVSMCLVTLTGNPTREHECNLSVANTLSKQEGLLKGTKPGNRDAV